MEDVQLTRRVLAGGKYRLEDLIEQRNFVHQRVAELEPEIAKFKKIISFNQTVLLVLKEVLTPESIRYAEKSIELSIQTLVDNNRRLKSLTLFRDKVDMYSNEIESLGAKESKTRRLNHFMSSLDASFIEEIFVGDEADKIRELRHKVRELSYGINALSQLQLESHVP